MPLDSFNVEQCAVGVSATAAFAVECLLLNGADTYRRPCQRSGLDQLLLLERILYPECAPKVVEVLRPKVARRGHVKVWPELVDVGDHAVSALVRTNGNRERRAVREKGRTTGCQGERQCSRKHREGR